MTYEWVHEWLFEFCVLIYAISFLHHVSNLHLVFAVLDSMYLAVCVRFEMCVIRFNRKRRVDIETKKKAHLILYFRLDLFFKLFCNSNGRRRLDRNLILTQWFRHGSMISERQNGLPARETSTRQFFASSIKKTFTTKKIKSRTSSHPSHHLFLYAYA